MKKYSFWINVFLLTFLLGISVVIVWFASGDISIKAENPPPILANTNCVEPKNFPGLSKQISELKKSESGYFPKGFFSDKEKLLDDAFSGRYGRHLKAMKEKSLLDLSDEKMEVYRFLWLRTFHHPIFVRIEYDGKEINLFTKELNGAGGYEPGNILRNSYRKINESEWCSFLKIFYKTDYWEMTTKDNRMLFDGARWILEGVKNGRYHVVDRQSPDNGDYREACIYLLKLSGIDTDKLGDDLY